MDRSVRWGQVPESSGRALLPFLLFPDDELTFLMAFQSDAGAFPLGSFLSPPLGSLYERVRLLPPEAARLNTLVVDPFFPRSNLFLR